MMTYEIGTMVRYAHPDKQSRPQLDGSIGTIIRVVPPDDHLVFEGYNVEWHEGPILESYCKSPTMRWGPLVLQPMNVAYTPSQEGDLDDDI